MMSRSSELLIQGNSRAMPKVNPSKITYIITVNAIRPNQISAKVFMVYLPIGSQMAESQKHPRVLF